MNSYEAVLYTDGGKQIKRKIAAEKKQIGRAAVYYFGAKLGSGYFDAFNGAEIFLKEDCVGFCASRLFSPYWCQPYFGNDLKDVPDRTQALLLEKDSGYTFMLAMCGSEYKTFLKGGESGLKAVMYSQKSGLDKIENQAAFIIAEGDNPKEIIRACSAAALEVTVGKANMREDRAYPPVLDYLGWCTWDALHVHVSESGIIEKIKEFKSKNIPVKYVIIDDMWADCTDIDDIPLDMNFYDMLDIQHKSTMNDFTAAPSRFPKGLENTVKLIHGEGLKVGIWYPVSGYWYGITAGGALNERFKDCFITVSDGRIVVKPEYDKAKKVYDYFNNYLKDCGVDFIKVDNQACYERYYKDVDAIGNAARNLQRAVEDSANEIFGGNVINCMGMASECMLNRKSSAVCRMSNDFMPENAEWFSKHVLQCAYNSLFYGEVYVGDWDMWWTDDGQAQKNSLLRAISGGPVYVSDRLNRSNRDILSPIVTDDGKILRADASCVPVKECLTCDSRTSGKPLAVFNRAGDSVLIAAFDIDAENKGVSGKIDLKQFGFTEDVLVYDYFDGARKIYAAGGAIEVELKNNAVFKYFVLTPVSKDKSGDEKKTKFLFMKESL